jgi:hypothetical protein
MVLRAAGPKGPAASDRARPSDHHDCLYKRRWKHRPNLITNAPQRTTNIVHIPQAPLFQPLGHWKEKKMLQPRVTRCILIWLVGIIELHLVGPRAPGSLSGQYSKSPQCAGLSLSDTTFPVLHRPRFKPDGPDLCQHGIQWPTWGCKRLYCPTGFNCPTMKNKNNENKARCTQIEEFWRSLCCSPTGSRRCAVYPMSTDR